MAMPYAHGGLCPMPHEHLMLLRKAIVKTLYRLWIGCDRLIKQKQPRIDVEKPSQSLSLLLGDF